LTTTVRAGTPEVGETPLMTNVAGGWTGLR
jgi:hypothetical protein